MSLVYAIYIYIYIYIIRSQATMPSTLKRPSRVPMWRGAVAAYLLIALCMYPVAIGGFWAYGDLVS